MDARLVAWARAVKARHRHDPHAPPVLWLFTDERRLPDPRPAAAALPCGLAGIVFRHDGDPHRVALGHALARICRARRLSMVVAGDVGLAAALGAGVHLRGGRWPGQQRIEPRMLTSSAHSAVELHRARRAGARLVFLSPAFPTRSHPDARALGQLRWARLARHAGLQVAALGGIDHATVRLLPVTLCSGIGAIGALA